MLKNSIFIEKKLKMEFFSSPLKFYKTIEKCNKLWYNMGKGVIKINWLDIEINEKIYKRILITGIIIIIAYCIIMLVSISLPRVYKMDKNTVLDENGIIKNGVNSLYRGANRLDIFGWAYKQGQDLKSFQNYYVLKNIETGKMYVLNTGMKDIPELEKVDEQYDCSNGGMRSQAIVLGIDDGTYELYVLYKSDGESILSKTQVVVEI